MSRGSRHAPKLIPAILAIELLTGCGVDVPRPPRDRVKLESSTPAWPMEASDGLGRSVALEGAPGRIVSLAPSLTKILYAIGAGPQVVGGTIQDDDPPESVARAKVGGMAPSSVSLEAIVALQPDLILATAGGQRPLVEPLERLGLTVAAIDVKDLGEIARNIRLVGRLTGCSERAEPLAARFLQRAEEIHRRTAPRSSASRVLSIVRGSPPATVEAGTFIGQIIEVVGGIDIFADAVVRFPRPSDENVVVRAPEIILASSGTMGDGGRDHERRCRRIATRTGEFTSRGVGWPHRFLERCACHVRRSETDRGD